MIIPVEAYREHVTPLPASTTELPMRAFATEVVGVMRELREEFNDTVIEGRPAAWTALTRALGDTVPLEIRGHTEGRGKTVTVIWGYEDAYAVNTADLYELEYPSTTHTYIAARIELPTTPEGQEIANAINELAAPPRRKRWRPPLEPLLGVQSYWDKEQGTYVFPADQLRHRVTEKLATLATRVEVGDMPNDHVSSTLAKDLWPSSCATSLLHSIERMALMNLHPEDDSALDDLMTACAEYHEAGLHSAQAVADYVRTKALARHYQSTQGLWDMARKLRDEATMPKLSNHTVTATW